MSKGNHETVIFARIARGNIWAVITLIVLIGCTTIGVSLFASPKPGVEFTIVERALCALAAAVGSVWLYVIQDRSLSVGDRNRGRAIWLQDGELVFAGRRVGTLDQIDFENTGRGGAMNAQFVLRRRDGQKFEIPLIHIGAFTGGADQIVGHMRAVESSRNA